MSWIKRQNARLEEHEPSRVDWFLIAVVAFVLLIGLVNLYSTTFDPVKQQSVFLTKQLVFIGIAGFMAALTTLIDYRWFEQLANIFYFVNLFLLIGVRFLGVVRNGARLWYDFGVFAYQPSETMKLAMLIMLAKFFHLKKYRSKMTLHELITPCLIVFVPALITIAQPDMGTGFQMAITGFSVILFFGVRPKILWSGALMLAMSFPVIWQYGLKEYQKNRIRVVLDPMKDPRGAGYNSIQSMVAVGSGQIIGKGFQKGTQTQLGFTPEGYTDFIFTVLAEEWGFLGAFVFFVAYIALIVRCFHIASQSREKFGLFLAFGIACLIAWQGIINIAMVIGIFPIVGIPLPLLSYGGSSILTIMLSLGLVLNINYRKNLF